MSTRADTNPGSVTKIKMTPRRRFAPLLILGDPWVVVALRFSKVPMWGIRRPLASRHFRSVCALRCRYKGSDVPRELCRPFFRDEVTRPVVDHEVYPGRLGGAFSVG